MTENPEFRSDEERWRQDGIDNRWSLPKPAHWLLRLPVIRHIRAGYFSIRIEWHYGSCPVGLRTGYDEWVLYAIARGWC